MRRNFPSVLFFICAFSLAAFSQSVVVTPKKTVYQRPKPLMDFKKSFTLNRPKVKAATVALSKKIENTISYEKNFDFNVKEETDEVQWLEEASYEINYNKNGILGVTLSMLGTGAYPSNYDKSVIVNIKTGEKVFARDVFIKLPELTAKSKKAQQEEIKNALAQIKKDEPNEENPEQLFENSDYTVKHLDEFFVSDKGVTFWYDYGFPHVVLALQPEGKYFFS